MLQITSVLRTRPRVTTARDKTKFELVLSVQQLSIKYILTTVKLGNKELFDHCKIVPYCQLFTISTTSTIYGINSFYLGLAQDPHKIWESRKNGIQFFLNAIILLVPKGFHIIYGSRILWALFSVKSLKQSKKILKSLFFANFHNLLLTNAKFWHFLGCQSSLFNSRCMV